jgi:hypothetical protein
VFAATENRTAPFPGPPLTDVMVMNPDCEAAVQLQSDSVVTLTVPVPPAAGEVKPVGDTVYVHGVARSTVTTAMLLVI